MKLQPTLTGRAPAVDVTSVLQLLESSRATGTFQLGTHSIRLSGGTVVKASGEPVATIAALMVTPGEFRFRAVQGTPNGALRQSVTALLLEAARIADEAQVQAA